MLLAKCFHYKIIKQHFGTNKLWSVRQRDTSVWIFNITFKLNKLPSFLSQNLFCSCRYLHLQGLKFLIISFNFFIHKLCSVLVCLTSLSLASAVWWGRDTNLRQCELRDLSARWEHKESSFIPLQSLHGNLSLLSTSEGCLYYQADRGCGRSVVSEKMMQFHLCFLCSVPKESHSPL